MEFFSQADLPWLVGGEAPGRVHGEGQLCRPDQHDGKQPWWRRCRWGEGEENKKACLAQFLLSGEQWLNASLEDEIHRPLQGSKVRCLSLRPSTSVTETWKPFLVWKKGRQQLSGIDEYLKLRYFGVPLYILETCHALKQTRCDKCRVFVVLVIHKVKEMNSPIAISCRKYTQRHQVLPSEAQSVYLVLYCRVKLMLH